MRMIKVWDLPTRLFHWALVASIVLAYFTSAGRPHGLLFALHLTGGYAVVLLLLFRLAWGVFGGEHARFASFLSGWAQVKQHASELLRLAPERSLGHNATGGWMIVLMLATLLAIVLTGLFAQGVTGGAGPLSGVLPTALVRPVGNLHQVLGNAILVLAGLHIVGVLAESLLNRENLVRAMITGRKSAAAAEARDARAAPPVRAVLLIVLLAFLGGVMVGLTRMPPAPSGAAQGAPRNEVAGLRRGAD
ncbi:MAG: cytochrome b/b6 domain-containing protein [Alphaproteobacteria bacterium]